MNDQLDSYVAILRQSVQLSLDAVEAWREVKARKAAIAEAGSSDTVPQELRDRVDEAMQALFDQLLDSDAYLGSVPEEEDRIVFSRSINDRLLDIDFLLTISRAAVPLAIVRATVGVNRIMFSEKKVAGWRRYAERYKEVLLRGAQAT